MTYQAFRLSKTGRRGGGSKAGRRGGLRQRKSCRALPEGTYSASAPGRRGGILQRKTYRVLPEGVSGSLAKDSQPRLLMPFMSRQTVTMRKHHHIATTPSLLESTVLP